MTKPLSWSTWRSITLGIAFLGAASHYLPQMEHKAEGVVQSREYQEQQSASAALVPIGLVLAAGAEWARRRRDRCPVNNI
jgi:hypothetical protein